VRVEGRIIQCTVTCAQEWPSRLIRCVNGHGEVILNSDQVERQIDLS
jgi:hypothetical protein